MSNGWAEATGSEAVDFNSVLDDGTYSFNIEKVELRQSNTSGNKYVNFWLKEFKSGSMVFYPIYASADYANHNNKDWAFSQVNALKRLYMVAKVTPPTAMPTPSDLQSLSGANIDAKVTSEPDQNGEKQNKIIDCYPCSSEPVAKEVIGEVVSVDDDIPF